MDQVRHRICRKHVDVARLQNHVQDDRAGRAQGDPHLGRPTRRRTSRRTRRLRRLIVLSLAIAGVATSATYVTRQRAARREAGYQQLRQEGLSAYAAGNYVLAVDKLNRYGAHHDDDAAALLPLAIARSKVPAAEDAHIRASIRTLARVMELEPENATARNTLLGLLIQTGDTDWMDRLANDALAADSKDTIALQARLAARIRQGRDAEAITAAVALADARPDDLDTRALVLRLMNRQNRPADADAFALMEYANNDPRHELLAALADVFAGRRDTGLARLRTLAGTKPADIAFVRQLLTGFDSLGQFDDALALLSEAVSRTQDPALTRHLAMRLWQRGDNAELVALHTGDAFIDGLRAAALHRQGRDDAGNAILAELMTRTEPAALAWSIALPAYFTPPNGAPKALLFAITKDPDNAVIRQWLGERYAAAQNHSLALAQFSAAAMLEPIWAAPHAGRAAALVALGRAGEAVDAARAAYDRKPGVNSAITLILTRYAAMGASTNVTTSRELLAAIDAVQAVRPGEAQTLAVRAAILQQLGRPVQSAPPGTPAALAALARESGDSQRLAEALAAADLALAERPSDVETRLLQAGLLAQMGRRAAAESSLRAILNVRPDHAAAANDLAFLLVDSPSAASTSALNEAEELVRRAITVSPLVATYHDTLARVLIRNGRSSEARREFQTALQLDPSLAAAKSGLAELDGQRVMTE
jgi:Flp pilus assembly protein TadD